jgi:hypothetical protein
MVPKHEKAARAGRQAFCGENVNECFAPKEIQQIMYASPTAAKLLGIVVQSSGHRKRRSARAFS